MKSQKPDLQEQKSIKTEKHNITPQFFNLSLIFLIICRFFLIIGCAARQIDSPVRARKEFIPGYKSSLIVGCLGPEVGEFDHPTGITIDQKGNIYVTDTGNHRVQGFNPKGQSILCFSGVGDGLSTPTGITSFKDGLLVVDRSRNKLFAFNRYGRLLNLDFTKELAQFKDLNQVARGKDGKIYGVEGDRAITLKGDYLYIADIDKIQKFRIRGNNQLDLVLEFGRWGNGQGEFMLPQGIAVDQQECIYVADTLNNRIQKFSPNGKFILAISGLNKPTGLAITKIGEIWVVENGAHRLQKFIPEIEVVVPPKIAKEGNYEWVYNRGRQLQSAKEFYQAIAYYKRCIEIKPDSSLAPKAQLQIGRCFRKIGNIEMAFMAYGQVVEDYPRSKEAPKALLEKGELLEELSLFEDARRAYERIVKEYPDSKENKRAEERIEYIKEKILGG